MLQIHAAFFYAINYFKKACLKSVNKSIFTAKLIHVTCLIQLLEVWNLKD